MGEALGGSLLQRQVMPRAQAGVDRERNRKRQRGLLVEYLDRLFPSVFPHHEVLFLETANRSPLRVGYGDVDIDQLDVDLERVFRFSRRLGLGRRLLRVRSAGQQQQNQRDGFSHSVNEVYVGTAASAVQSSGARRLLRPWVF